MHDSFQRISRFDQVVLRTTKNVTYLSAPPGTNITPDGKWSVAGVIDNDLLIVKNSTTIRIPIADVIKIRDHDVTLGQINSLLERENGQKTI
jgi:hypothetical protein